MDTKKLRQKILDLAIQGKLVPQDPNDEPASVLLERISKEKERLIKAGKIKRSKQTASSDLSSDDVPFDLPEGWCWTKIANLFLFIRNGKSIQQIKGAAGIPITRIETISNHDINRGRMGYANILDIKGFEDYLLCNGDILMSHINSSIHVGRSAICCDIKDNEQIIHGMNLLCFRPSSFVFPKYANYYFNCIVFRDLIRPFIKNAVNQASINTENIGNTLLPLPPLAEQKRIVSAVEQWMSVIDVLENNEEDLRQSIDKAKSKILDLAIRGKLVLQDSNDEPASDLLKRLGISPDYCPCEDLPFELPNGWCWTILKDVSYQIGTRENQILSKDVQQKGLIPVVSQSAQIIDGYCDEINRKVSDIPVILFGDHTRVVKFIDFEFVVGADGTKLLKSRISEKYLYYWTKVAAESIRNRGYARHFALLKQVPIPLPPLAEQHRIVTKIEQLYSQLDEIESSLQ